jgi:DNA-binding transcriptional regulator YiaG
MTIDSMDIAELDELSRLRSFLQTGEARRIRERAGLSLGEVARGLGVSPSTLHRWEGGKRSPRGEAALRYWQLLRRLMGRS